MSTPNHEGLRVLFETLNFQHRAVVFLRDALGTEALVFDDTIAAAIPGGLVRIARLTSGSLGRQVRRLALGSRQPTTSSGDASRPPVFLVSCAEGPIQIEPWVGLRLAFGETVPVEEFYTSSVVRDALVRAKALATPSRIRLLSARRGLVTLSDWVTRATRDDVCLDELTANERRAWGARIVRELIEDYGLKRRDFLLLAGRQHEETLREAWPPDAPQLRLVPAEPTPPCVPGLMHPTLCILAALHRAAKGARAEVLFWRGADGTQAVAFGQRLFAVRPGGRVQTAPAALLLRPQAGRLPSIEQVVRDLLVERDERDEGDEREGDDGAGERAPVPPSSTTPSRRRSR